MIEITEQKPIECNLFSSLSSCLCTGVSTFIIICTLVSYYNMCVAPLIEYDDPNCRLDFYRIIEDQEYPSHDARTCLVIHNRDLRYCYNTTVDQLYDIWNSSKYVNHSTMSKFYDTCSSPGLFITYDDRVGNHGFSKKMIKSILNSGRFA